MCEKSSKFSNHSATSDFLFQNKQGSKNDTGRILKFRREVQWVVVTPSSCVFFGVVFRISTYLFLLRPFYMSKNLGRKRNRFVRFLDINWLCNHIHPGSKKCWFSSSILIWNLLLICYDSWWCIFCWRNDNVGSFCQFSHATPLLIWRMPVVHPLRYMDFVRIADWTNKDCAKQWEWIEEKNIPS